MLNRLRSMTINSGKATKSENDAVAKALQARKRKAQLAQKKQRSREAEEESRESLMKEYLALYRQGPLPTTNNAYVQYVLNLIDLFRKMWESHLEWTTNHILNHIAVEMAIGEVLFAKDDDGRSDDVHAIQAARVLEYALSLARFRYHSSKRDIKVAEAELKKCIGRGDERSQAASESIGMGMSMNLDMTVRGRGGEKQTDMTAVVSRSLNSVSGAVYDLLYRSTIEASLTPKKDRSGLRPSLKQDEEDREMMESFGDVWIACEEPLLSALELLWPAAGVEVETEINDAMLMSAIFGVSSPGLSVPSNPEESSAGSVTSLGSPVEGGSSKGRLRSSLLYGLVRGQCLQALIRCAKNLKDPQIDLTPENTPLDTPRGTPVYITGGRSHMAKTLPPFPWQVYHRTMDLVHAKLSTESIHRASDLADAAMYAHRLLPIGGDEEDNEDSDLDIDSVDNEAASMNNSRPSTRQGGAGGDSAYGSFTEPSLGQSRQWVVLVEDLWHLRSELPRPLPALPSHMAGSSAPGAMVYAFRGDDESKLHTPRQIRSSGYTLASGYSTGYDLQQNAEFVEEGKDYMNHLNSPRHAGNTSVWATKGNSGQKKYLKQAKDAKEVSKAYEEATKEQIDFYETERQQAQQRELAHRQEVLAKEKAEYDLRMQQFTLERLAARASLDFVDKVYVDALVSAMEKRGVRFLGRSYFAEEQEKAKQKADADQNRVGNNNTSHSFGHEQPFQGPPRGWTQTLVDGAAVEGTTSHASSQLPTDLGSGGGTPSIKTNCKTSTSIETSSNTMSTQLQSSIPQCPLPGQTPVERSSVGGPSATASLVDSHSEAPSAQASMLVQLPIRAGLVLDSDYRPEASEESGQMVLEKVDPTSIAEHGRLAYLPSDSELSQDFNVSHGTHYYDPLGDVIRGPNPEDRDERSIVGEGQFAHHLDPFATGHAVDHLQEDSLVDYKYNTTQLFPGGDSMAFEARGPVDVHGKNAFLDIDNTARDSLSSSLTHPYRRHLPPGSGLLGDINDLSRSLVTMELPRNDNVLENVPSGNQDSPLHKPESSWAVADVTEAVSVELSAVSKVFPPVTYAGDGSGTHMMQAEAHWTLSLRSLPAVTETRTFQTSQGITLTYTPLDSRPELRQLEWHLSPNRLPLAIGPSDVSGIGTQSMEKPRVTKQNGDHVADLGKETVHGGRTSLSKGDNSDVSTAKGGVVAPLTTSLSMIDSSIASGSVEDGAGVTGGPNASLFKTTGAPRSVLEYANDETLVAYLDPTDPTVRLTQLHFNPSQALHGSIRRAKRDDDDATIDHMYVNNEEYDNKVEYLPFDVDSVDDSSVVSADLLTVSTFYSDAPHRRAEAVERARRERGCKAGGEGLHEDDDDADFESYRFFDPNLRPTELGLLSKENMRAHSAQVHRYDHDIHDNEFTGSEAQGTRFGASNVGRDSITGNSNDNFQLASVREDIPAIDSYDGGYTDVEDRRAGRQREIVYQFIPQPIRLRPSPVVLLPPMDPTSVVIHNINDVSSGKAIQRHNLLASRALASLPPNASPKDFALHPMLINEPRVGRRHNLQFRIRAKGVRWKSIDGKILFGSMSCNCDCEAEPKLEVDKIKPVLEWADPADIVFPTQLQMAIADPNEPDGFPKAPAPNEMGDRTRAADVVGSEDSNKEQGMAQLCAKAYDSTIVKKPSRTPLRGRYIYNPPAGTVLGVGHHSLSVIFIPEDFSKYRSGEFKAFRSIYVSKGTPILDYTPIDKEDILVAGTPLPDKYFDCHVKEGDAGSLARMRAGEAVCRGPDGPWMGLILPTAEHQRLHLKWIKGVEALRLSVKEREYSRRQKLSQARRAVREYQQRNGHENDQNLTINSEIEGSESNDDENSTHGSVQSSDSAPEEKEPDYSAILTGLIAELRERLSEEMRTMLDGEYLFSHKRGDVLERGKNRIWCQYRPSSYMYKHYKFGYSSIPFEVGARAPNMIFPEVPPINYLTPLSKRQLKAFVNEPWPIEPVHNGPASLPPDHAGRGWGAVTYDPCNDVGTILDAGRHTLWAYFEPFDPNVFRKTKVSMEIEVLQVPSEIIWLLPAPIYDGHPVTEAQLNARAEVPDSNDERQGGGTFDYNIKLGTILPLGEHPVSVVFTPEYPHRYSTVTIETKLRVLRPKEPALHWPELDDIRYPSPLSRLELCVRVSSLNCTGKFIYDPPLNTILNAGQHILSCTFMPDLPQWCSTTITAPIVVQPARPRLRWSEPGSIIHGSAIKEHILCAEAVNTELRKENCLFTYKPPVNTVLDLGSHTLTAYFEAINEDAPNYEKGEITCTLVVRQRPKKKTTISWPKRVPSLCHPEKLTTTEHLTAVCNEAKGMFVFTPNPGVSLNVGTHELKCKFYPENTDYYMTAEAKSKITVERGTCTLKYKLDHDDCFFDYGRPLDRRILCATCMSHIGTVVPGNYEYYLNGKPLDGPEKNDDAQRLDAGSHRITCKFTPSVEENWNAPDEVSVDIFVARVTPVLKWPKPQTAIYPAVLTEKDHLNCKVVTEFCRGSFKYSHEPTYLGESDDDEGKGDKDKLQEDEHSEGSSLFSPSLREENEPDHDASDENHEGGEEALKRKGDESLGASAQKKEKKTKAKLLKAGKHHLKCRFTPDDPVNFYGADKSTVWEIEKGMIPFISWNIKSNKLVYGEGLDASLHFTCLVDHPNAHYEYYPPEGTKLPVGRFKIRCRVTILGEEADCYEPLTMHAAIVVTPMTPTLYFPGAPEEELFYGEPLSLGRHLNARVDIAGYAPSDIALLGLRKEDEENEQKLLERGLNQQKVKELRAKKRVIDEELERAKQSILDMAAEIADHEANRSDTDGGESSAISLDSSVQRQKERIKTNLPRGYVYTPRPDTLLPAGTHTIYCHFEPPDGSVNIGRSARMSSKVTVKRSVPKIYWKAPASLKYGMALTEKELNASIQGPLKAVAKGEFTYSPPLGTILPVGEHRLSVVFQPKAVDSVDRVSKRVTINVFKVFPSFTWEGAPKEVPKGYRMTDEDLCATCVGIDGVPLEGKYVYTPSFGNVIGAPGKREIRVEFFLKGEAQNLYFKPKAVVVEVQVAKS